MDCPECKEKCHVIDSRTKRFNITRRRYKCNKCDFKFTTYEKPEQELLKTIQEKFLCSTGMSCPFKQEGSQKCTYTEKCSLQSKKIEDII